MKEKENVCQYSQDNIAYRQKLRHELQIICAEKQIPLDATFFVNLRAFRLEVTPENTNLISNLISYVREYAALTNMNGALYYYDGNYYLLITFKNNAIASRIIADLANLTSPMEVSEDFIFMEELLKKLAAADLNPSLSILNEGYDLMFPISEKEKAQLPSDATSESKLCKNYHYDNLASLRQLNNYFN